MKHRQTEQTTQTNNRILNRFLSGTTVKYLPIFLTICVASTYILGEIYWPAHGESLFRVSASHYEPSPYTPTSLFAQPIPRAIGDIVTIQVSETTTLSNSSELEVARDQTINQNGDGILNSILRSVGVPRFVGVPSLNGLNNSNDMSSSAEATRSTSLSDRVTCQVVQVMPNGNLVVQGNKLVSVNRERVNMMVSGIVNPYYLDQRNTIQSNQIANFQIVMGGRGVISRQQSDGIYNKIMQFAQ